MKNSFYTIIVVFAAISIVSCMLDDSRHGSSTAPDGKAVASQLPATERKIPSYVDSNFSPDPNVEYFITGKELYRPPHGGPASGKTWKAWSIANEFVFRTALSKGHVLPAASVGPKGKKFSAVFNNNNGKQKMIILVDIVKRSAKIEE